MVRGKRATMLRACKRLEHVASLPLLQLRRRFLLYENHNNNKPSIYSSNALTNHQQNKSDLSSASCVMIGLVLLMKLYCQPPPLQSTYHRRQHVQHLCRAYHHGYSQPSNSPNATYKPNHYHTYRHASKVRTGQPSNYSDDHHHLVSK